MSTFLCTWDGSDAGYDPSTYALDVAATARGETPAGRWSFGSRRGGATHGDRVFLLRQGTGRGIVASGRLTDGEVFEEEHWEDPTKTARYVELVWDRVVPVAERLPIEELMAEVPGHDWNHVYGSGQQLTPSVAADLETRWAARFSAPADPRGWLTPLGATLSRRARGELYGGGLFGGIEPSAQTPNVFLYSDPTAGSTYGYDYDGWNADGSVFLYTGEGTVGDQKLTEGNLATLRHRVQGRALRLFVADGTEPGNNTKVQRYVGEFQLDEVLPFVRSEAPDVAGASRSVIVFRLVPDGSILRRDEDRSRVGDVSIVRSLDTVLPGKITLTEGSAEAVPVEAVVTRTYEIAGSTSATAVKREAELATRFQKHLEDSGHTCIRYRIRPPEELRDLYTDIFDATDNVLYEAKGVATREAVRMAVGQLLDYSRHLPNKPTLAVLLPETPSRDLLDLLGAHQIRCVCESATRGSFVEA